MPEKITLRSDSPDPVEMLQRAEEKRLGRFLDRIAALNLQEMEAVEEAKRHA